MSDEMSSYSSSRSGKERTAWLTLARSENVGPVTFNRLVDRYGSASAALAHLPGLAQQGGRKGTLNIPSPAQISLEMERIEKKGGRLILSCDADYPLSLSVLEDAPAALTVFGHTHLLQRPCIALVGARNASLNGCNLARSIARECGARTEAVIVSGLARGIDTAAHEGSLASGTIAVVAGGADVIYPRENKKLYEAICQQGAIVAENPLGFQPRAKDFPRRNRIISGLSTGVVVIEATLRSGSLITARMAAEQGREVCAVPGFPGDPRAQGPNSLLKDGAILVRSAEDLFELLEPAGLYKLEDKYGSQEQRLSYMPDLAAHTHADSSGDRGAGYGQAEFSTLPKNNSPYELTNEERSALIESLSGTPTMVDELIRACQLTIGQVQEALLELELAGRLVRHAGNRVSLCTATEETR